MWQATRDINFFFPYMQSLPVERTYAMIKPDAVEKGAHEKILEEIKRAGLLIVGQKHRKVPVGMAEELYKEHKGKPFYDGLMQFICSDAGIVALCLEGPGAIERWRLLCGPTNSHVARETTNNSTLRAKYGTDGTMNAVHGSDSVASATRELGIFFPEGFQPERTLCLVKPDGVPNLVPICRKIEEQGFAILKKKQLTLSDVRAEEFFRDHVDMPYFASMIRFMTSGPVVAMVLFRAQAVGCFQQTLGPENAKVAKKDYPNSLRALFGRDGQ